MSEMMWAYLIHLGTNMWGDPGGTTGTEFFGEKALYDELPVYHPEMLTDRKVWEDVTAFLPGAGINTLVIDLGEGVRYDSHPELAVPGSLTTGELRTELKRLRELGLTPIPKLNFSACHDAWLGEYRLRRCTPEYYRVRKDLIDEVCDLFDKPAFFHIGMDEENLDCQRYMSIITIRNEELWWKDFYDLVENCERNNARAWCWSDYYWEHPDIFVRRMPKSVLQSNWSYHAVDRKGSEGKYPDHRYESYAELDRLGFDQVPCGSCWGYIHNLEQTVLLGRNEIRPEHLTGFMAAPWLFTTERSRYGLMDNANRLGIARKTYFDAR